ncbi:MAG: hypothetical protein Q9227_008156 [Pyrenula ochraceoflavens]
MLLASPRSIGLRQYLLQWQTASTIQPTSAFLYCPRLHRDPSARKIGKIRQRNANTLAPAAEYKPPKPSPDPEDEETPHSDEKPSKPTHHLLRPRSASLFIFGTLSWALGVYALFQYTSYQKFTSSATPEHPTGTPTSFDILAPDFDELVSTSEWGMGLLKRRKRLVEKAHGHVLEVGCGTGRNTEYYDLRKRKGKRKGKKGVVESVTFVDKSAAMVGVARGKWEEVWGDELLQDGTDNGQGARVRFVVADIEAPSSSESSSESESANVIPPPPASPHPQPQPSSTSPSTTTPTTTGYDTILSTMTLCSTPSPTTYLTSLLPHLRRPDPSLPGGNDNRGGRILLLEHGRGYFSWLNRLLDRSAEFHAWRFGCWWNRDVGRIVEELERNGRGVEVKGVRRVGWHAGTTWEVEIGWKEGGGEGVVDLDSGEGGGKEKEKEKEEEGWFFRKMLGKPRPPGSEEKKSETRGKDGRGEEGRRRGEGGGGKGDTMEEGGGFAEGEVLGEKVKKWFGGR